MSYNRAAVVPASVVNVLQQVKIYLASFHWLPRVFKRLKSLSPEEAMKLEVKLSGLFFLKHFLINFLKRHHSR